MNNSFKLLVVIVTVFLLVDLTQVDCRRTYSTSSSRGRGNRGKNQPSTGSGLFSSWFGGSKSSGSSSGSGSISKPSSSSVTAKKNWQTATSHTSSNSKAGWANPHYSAVPSAPKEPNYGWKPAVSSNSKPASSYPSSNIGPRGYPVQSGVQQGAATNYGGFKPAASAPSAPVLNSQSSANAFGGYKPSASIPNTHATNYQPSQSGFGGYKPASGLPNTPSNTHYQPSSVHNTQSGFGGYHPAPSHGYQPSHGAPNVAPSHGYQPSYGSHSYNPSSGYHPSAYPTQTGGFSGYHAPQSGFGHGSYGSSVPTYQGTSLFGGNSGHYGYPGSGSWGINTYGAKKSSGTGKLLTGLAVGAAGGYLTSSLVNSISNPWKYSGYGYGSGFGYGSTSTLTRVRDESAFERGYERGVRDRNENKKDETAAPVPPPTPEDPTSNWVNCVAFDPQTQQTLINPNCSCTVTTSLDERTGQPISVHHCTTLNGLVMKPIPIQPNQGQSLPTNNEQPATGVNAPGVVPSYGSAYQENAQYGAGAAYAPFPTEVKSNHNVSETKPETTTATGQTASEPKVEAMETTETKLEQGTAGTVVKPEVAVNVTNVDFLTSTGGGNTSEPKAPNLVVGGSTDSQKSAEEFFGQLQKIVNMGNFVDGG